MSETLPIVEVKNKLSKMVERVRRQQDRVTITVNGVPAAVLISVDDLESLEETLAVMSDPEAMAAIRESEAERVAGIPGELLTKEQALARWGPGGTARAQVS